MRIALDECSQVVSVDLLLQWSRSLWKILAYLKWKPFYRIVSTTVGHHAPRYVKLAVIRLDKVEPAIVPLTGSPLDPYPMKAGLYTQSRKTKN
jgi:hypothetical protein